MSKLIVFVLALILTSGYVEKKHPLQKEVKRTVVILPLGKVDNSILIQVEDSVRKYFPSVVVAKAENMPSSAWYKPRGRYRADTLIHWMSKRASSNQIWLGFTSTDISTTKGKNPDSGIMGLGFCPGNACIVSSYRIRNKSNVYKVAIHELGHTLGLPHCPNTSCYMQDAKGKDVTGREKYLCSKCSKSFL